MSTDYRWKYWRKLLTFRLWRPDIGKMQLNVSEGMSESPGCTPHSPSDGYQCILLFEEASSTESAKCPCKPEKTNHKNNILKTASMLKKKVIWWFLYEGPCFQTSILSDPGWLLFRSIFTLALSLCSSFSFTSKALISFCYIRRSFNTIKHTEKRQDADRGKALW